MENKLLILGEVLENNLSTEQLYNLIQIHSSSISSIIFKDTGRIPSKTFIDLMNQLLSIDSIKEISFISSVIEPENFHDLQYLIRLKQVQFVVLYRSHFFQKELEMLMRIHATLKAPQTQKVDINHFRYTILDLFEKTHYEFTPFAFKSLSSTLKQNTIENERTHFSAMMDAERLYHQQQLYPKQIYNRIIFYQGKHLSILSRNISDRILFKYLFLLILFQFSNIFQRYWRYVKRNLDQKARDEKLNLDEVKQEELISVIESQLRWDDVNVVNCGLVKQLISMIQEEELREKFTKTYQRQKSFKNLESRYPIRVVENIHFQEKHYISACLAYLMGFTRISGQSLYFYVNNGELHECLCRNQYSFDNLETKEYSIIIKESLMITIDKQILRMLTSSIQFNRLTHLSLDEIRGSYNFENLTDVLRLCTNLKCLSMRDCLLNDRKMKTINFSLISTVLEEIDLSMNRDIDDFGFLTSIFIRAVNLRILILSDMQIIQPRLKNVNFTKFSKSLEKIDLSSNDLSLCTQELNKIFLIASELKELILVQCQLVQDTIASIKFPASLVALNLSQNKAAISIVLEIILKINMPRLLKLDLSEVNKQDVNEINNNQDTTSLTLLENDYNSVSQKNLNRLETLILHQNQMNDVDGLNRVLQACKNLKKLTLTYQQINQGAISRLNLSHLYENLRMLDLSYNYFFQDCEFLNQIFENVCKLEDFRMRYCALSNEKLVKVKFSLISETLEEFHIGGNGEVSNITFINDIIKKCQRLRVLHLDQLRLTDEKINGIDFSQISSHLEDIDLSQNDKLTRFYFLNDILIKAKHVKRINLTGIPFNENQYEHLAFDNLSFELESFRIDERKGLTDKKQNSFTDWLAKKLNRYLNIRRFLKNHANVDTLPYLNYYGVSESFNLTQYRMSNEEIKFKSRRKNSSLKMSKNQSANIMESQTNIQRNKELTQLGGQVNIFYFYSFFKKLGQSIDEKQKSSEEWKLFFSKIIEDQNVYVDQKYLLLQYIEDPKILESLDLDSLTASDIVPFVRVLDFSERKTTQSFFIRYIIEHCDQLERVNLSNMQPLLLSDLQTECHTCLLTKLYEIDLSNNSNSLSITKEKVIQVLSLVQLMNSLLKSSPNLRVLKLSNAGLRDDTLFSPELLPASLQELDLSGNVEILNFLFLNDIFKKCDLRVLNLSNLALTNEKLQGVSFAYVNEKLEFFDISNNTGLNSFQFLNDLFNQCKKLKILNLSNLNIDHIKNKTIDYSKISPLLKEIDLSCNSIVFFMEFLTTLLTVALELEKIDFSQQRHLNSYESKPITVPSNKLQVLNISGNIMHISFAYAPEIISKSVCFKKLIVQEFNLTQQRLSQLLETKENALEELDISHNMNISDLSPLNRLNISRPFLHFIACDTSINNHLLSQLNIASLFSRIETLNFSKNLSIVDFSFFNLLFKSAKNLKSLNMSYMDAEKSQIDIIDFSLLPSSLRSIDFSGNDKISQFSFLNIVFQSASKSLQFLGLSDINADNKSFADVRFDLLVNTIETIDLSKNSNLFKIPFLTPLLNQLDSTLKKLIIDRFIFEISEDIRLTQVHKIQCKHIRYKYNFFTQNKYLAHINILKFINFLQLSYKQNIQKSKYFKQI